MLGEYDELERLIEVRKLFVLSALSFDRRKVLAATATTRMRPFPGTRRGCLFNGNQYETSSRGEPSAAMYGDALHHVYLRLVTMERDS